MIRSALLAFLLVGGADASASGQTLGFWLGGGLATRGEAAIDTDFSTPPLFGLEGTGRATQQVDAPRVTTPAFEGGVQWFPSRRGGVEVWMSRDSGDDLAQSSPYRTTLTYVARQPPDHLPRSYEYAQRTDWPPVRVDLTRLSVGLNGAVRPAISERMAWIVSGGLAWVRLSGTAEPLGFTTFGLGGHSVLFPNEYALTTDLERDWAWCGNVGTMVDTRLSAHLAFTVGARAVLGADRDLRLRVVGVDASRAGFEAPDTDDIDALLSTSAARVPTRSFRLVLGLKAVF